MTITFDLPSEVEQVLRLGCTDVNLAAKEAALVELYRMEKLSHRQLSEALGISRMEAETVLKRHHVTEDLPTQEEYERALRHLGAAPGI